MLNILISWGSPFRAIAVMIDSVAFTLIDQAYNVIVAFSSASLFKDETIQAVMHNTYILIGIFALFRIAMLLVNAIINPDKLNEKGNGLGNVLANLIVMFVLLIMVPILFKEAYSLQETVVNGNYIQKIFLNSNSLDNINPGDTMRSIAIGSLITIDKEAQDQYKAGRCSNNCNEAIESYNNMAKNNNFEFAKLGKYIGVTIKDDNGNTVYVYNYMFVLTFLCGATITYVLFSFGIDIAVRMVELAILQILAPMFIATYIDPKSAKSGPFHKWLTTVGKTYVSLFIKLAILSLMLLFISLLNGGLKQDIHGFNKLILLFAILIFAKKAPSWIGGMIGVDGEGSGLGGLGIGKKLAGAALVGGALSKGLEGAKNFAGQKGKNFLANRARNTAARVGGMKEAHADNKRLKQNGITGEAYRNNKKSLWKQGRAAAKNSRQANWGQDSQGFFKDVAQGYMGGRQNVNPSAETLSEHFKGKADLKAKMYNDKIGNTQEALQKRKENAEKLKTASQMRMGKVNLDAKGERDAKLDWQGYNEFKTAIGSDVMTEAEAYTRDMKIKAARGENGWHLDGDKVRDGSGKEITWEDNKKTFTVAGQKDITSFTTKNFQNQSETLKTNIDLRVENDQKIAGYNAQIANLKASGVAVDDPSIKNLNDLVGQLETQNETINEQNKNIIKNLQTSEKSYESAPHKCPTAVQIDNNKYKTATGTFTRASENAPFVYSVDSTAAENFMLDVTVINEVMNKVANVANKNDKEAEKAHSALEPKSS